MENKKILNLNDILRSLLENDNISEIREIFEEINEVKLAEILENDFSPEEIVKIFRKIPKEIVADVFSYFSNNVKENVISLFTDKEINIIFEYMFTDDISEFIQELPEDKIKKILNAASIERKAEINMILNFKEYSAGSIMNTDYISLSPDISVDKALDIIKEEEKLAETIDICYVVNENNTLIGHISMKTILLCPEDTIISDIMETDVISINTDDDQEEAAKLFQKYDLIVLPVVNKQHNLVGIITIDDVYDIIQEETTEDIQKMRGITPIDGSYTLMPITQMYKSRITWLLILMVSATVSGWIITKNLQIVELYPSLLIFIPVLMDTAGNAGSQSSAMVIRGIIVDDMDIKNAKYVLKTELLNSLILGGILFIVNMLRILIFNRNIDFKIALLVSITVYIVVTIANLIGGMLPLIATFFKQDPASMSSPILTTVCDAISLTTYFFLAKLILGGVLSV